MSTSLSIRLKMEPIRSLAYGSISSSYMGIGTAIDEAARMIYVTNLTDVILMFSLDGVEDHFALPANGFLLLDISANKTREQGYYIAEGTRFYVKTSGSPTSGTVYLSVMYGDK